MALVKQSRRVNLFGFLTKKRETYHARIVRPKTDTFVGSYQGKKIYRTPAGAFSTSIDRDSHHDTLKDAKAFIRSWKQNPVWKLVDSYLTKETAQEVGRRYTPHRIVRRKRKFEVWAKNPPRGNAAKVTDLIPGAGTILGTLDTTARAWGGVGKRVAKGVTAPLKRLKSKRNPVDIAALRYEEFTGFPPDRVIEVESRQHIHAKTYALGLLVALIVMDPDGKRFRTIMGPGVSYAGDLAEVYPAFIGEPKGHWEFNERTPTKDITWLTGSTGTRLGKKMVVQLFVQGGDQKLDTRALGLVDRDHHDHMLIGTLYRVWYRARKKFEDDGKQLFDFYHDFGKLSEGAGNICPVVTYKPLVSQIEIVGGRYQIALPEKSLGGLSPGIVG